MDREPGRVPECEVCHGPAPEGRPRQYGDESFEVVCRLRCDDTDPMAEYGVVVEDERLDDTPDEQVEALLQLTTDEKPGYRVEEVVVR